jgi:DNA-directed RNA polymerase
MPSIEAQLALEQTMIARGADVYAASNRNAETNGRGAETDYARRLMQEFLLPLVERLEAFTTTTGPASRGKARGLLRRIDPSKAMYLALKQVFNSFTHEVMVVHVASKIGMMIEDEIRFARFQEIHGDYYESIIEAFKRKGTKDYRFMHRSLTHSANEQNDGWIVWSSAERVDVGMRLLDIILTETDLVYKKTIKNKLKTEVYLSPTDEAQEWIKTHEAMASLMFPDKMPCVIQPDEWSGMHQGGYYSPQLRQATPMVKVSGPEQRKIIEANSLPEVTHALNTVQATPWTVNTDVLTVMREVWTKNLGIGMPPSQKLVPSPNPVQADKADMTEAQMERFKDWKREASEVYTKEKERVSKCFQVSRIVRMASQYEMYDRFWYVWYADFRGRLYTATAGFSPQGPDLAKGLLRFANGKALGDRGWYWLRVHGANRYGYDKASYDDRVQWVDERHAYFLAAADDPIAHRDVWQDADKPWQFLAFLFEYAAAVRTAGGPGSYVSHLPVGLDGSCNGLQNFSAMLRDERGGKATNLTPSNDNKPADIYAEVATVCYQKLLALKGDPMADLWLAYCDKYGKGTIPRSLAKRPVMTLPYGATRQSCTKYIFAHILETDNEHFTDGNFKAACWLTPHLWAAISTVVVAAREGMDWLQKCAGVMSKIGKPIIWCTSDGFPIVQFSKVVQTTQIETQLAGRFQVRVGTVTDKIDPNRQRSGVAPNFVHSQDAAHLRRTVRLARQYGIKDMALIHDDYGTHAADTDLLQKVIRAAFVLEYRDCDPLDRFARTQQAAGGKLPEMPPKGTLDLSQVIRSPFFFG